MAQVRVAGFFSLGSTVWAQVQNKASKIPWARAELSCTNGPFWHERPVRKMAGNAGGSDGVDEDYARPLDGRFRRLHPWPQQILGPVLSRGRMKSGRGWWGEIRLITRQCFVLTHYARRRFE